MVLRALVTRHKLLPGVKFLFFIPLFIVKFLLRTLGWVLTFTLCFYTQTPVFDFAGTRKFGGDQIFNPYQDLNGEIVKANFHAHSKAWGGFTNGHNAPEELLKSYHDKGYAYAGISNYFATEPLNEDLRVYEHGINLMKAHKLALNPSSVVYFDYPLFQNTSQKQDIINRLREKDALVAIAHPNFMKGHREEDMTLLTGYHFTEVLNHYRTSEKEWDAALKAGKLSWILANDDTHDIYNEPSHRIWNEICVQQPGSESMIKSLLEGKSYGISSKAGTNDLTIEYLQVNGDSVYFDFGNAAGKVRVLLDGEACDVSETLKGSVYFPKDGQYLRFVAESDESALYTNPIIRYEGGPPPLAAGITPVLNYTKTYLHRAAYSLGVVTMILLLTGFKPVIPGRFRLKRRQPAFT